VFTPSLLLLAIAACDMLRVEALSWRSLWTANFVHFLSRARLGFYVHHSGTTVSQIHSSLSKLVPNLLLSSMLAPLSLCGFFFSFQSVTCFLLLLLLHHHCVSAWRPNILYVFQTLQVETKVVHLLWMLWWRWLHVVQTNNSTLFGIGFPIYSTHKAIAYKNLAEQEQWLFYWAGAASSVTLLTPNMCFCFVYCQIVMAKKQRWLRIESVTKG
jgi:hypothetical protein